MKKLLSSLIIAISLTSLTASAADLSDISGNKNQSAIEYLYSNSVISGYPDGTFKPEKTVNRAELLKILVGGKGITPTVEEYHDCFPDVATEWFAPFVCYAKAEGWVGGYPDGSFQPAKDVNKVEALKMLVNSQEYTVPEDVTDKLFDDADSKEWYAPFLQVAKEKGLIETETGNYGIADNMTRAGISENIYRAMVITEKGIDKFIASTTYFVTRVVDGDTIEVNNDIKIRLIGVDTPETVDPNEPVQCYGPEASAIAKEKLFNQTVTLESDESQGDKDKYDRLLRYVIMGDGTNFNQWLIENGYGHEYTYSTPYKYQAEFKTAEQTAMTANAGLWAENACNEGEEEETITGDENSAVEDTTIDYVCSSNTYNCGDFNSKAEAQNAYNFCMAQVGTDIHKLDGDGNGLACESL